MPRKIGSFIIDIIGKQITTEESELLTHPLVGGIILFSRNYESRAQLTSLCQQLRDLKKTPLLILVDQEGGQVQRFVNGFTRLPRMAQFGALYDKNGKAACLLAKDCGWLMAAELLSVGIDLSLAPVLDLQKGINAAIGERAFHGNPEAVFHLTQAFVQGMQEAGMAATAKHFPGHGSVKVDSHSAIPVDERSLDEISNNDMIPFSKHIQTGISAIMAAHIVFTKIDKLPVCFSSRWLHDILRKRLGFTGAIFSDDLNMEGANISANYHDRFLAAREAGCDFVLLCNNRYGVTQVLDAVAYSAHLIRETTWQVLQGRVTCSDQQLQVDSNWRKVRQSLQEMTNF